jgi:hypothetical protein
MDWIELLIVVVFFGAPLIGRLFQQKPPAPPPAVPRGDAPSPADLQPRLPAPARTGAALPAPAGADGGWSAGWSQWPEGATEEEDAFEEGAEEEGVAGDHDLAADSIHTREAVSLEPVTAAEGLVRALPEAPVGLDTVPVDWNREHVRFHDKYFKAAPPPPRADRLADHLRSRAEVRRAILLAEVLGPPRSLRGLEDDG